MENFALGFFVLASLAIAIALTIVAIKSFGIWVLLIPVFFFVCWLTGVLLNEL